MNPDTVGTAASETVAPAPLSERQWNGVVESEVEAALVDKP